MHGLRHLMEAISLGTDKREIGASKESGKLLEYPLHSELWGSKYFLSYLST
jgi:hypothetical protein